MANKFPKRIIDGWNALDGGINSGVASNLINPNQASFAINLQTRGGWARPRPGIHKVTLNFQSADDVQQAFETLMFQLGEGYQISNGDGAIIAMIGGRQYRIDVTNNGTFPVNDITIPGDPNQPLLPLAWGAQGLNYFVIQNGSDKPWIYDGALAFRALPTQIPTGKQITCYQNRFWVADGIEYVAGNMAFDASAGGTAPLNFKDSILYFTENTLIAEGGVFSLPVGSSDITGFKPISSSNPYQSNGQGELIVATLGQAFAVNVPLDRTQWKNTTSPIQRVLQLSAGVTSQSSMVNINEDIWYRTLNGISTIAYTVRNQGQPGNRTLSNEVDRILKNDAIDFLQYCSGVEFDNRMIMTANPAVSRNHGIWHRGLVALDFFPISSMSKLTPPAWDGVWTGLRFLKILTVVHQSIKRCFVFSLNEFDKIELWEITKDSHFDHDGTDEVKIEWELETRSLTYGTPYDLKQLESSDFFWDSIDGDVTIDFLFRPDNYPCWINWQTVNTCGKTELCAPFGTCPTLPNFKPNYVTMIQLQQPPDTFDELSRQRYRTFCELQLRLIGEGYCRLKQQNVYSSPFELDFREGQQLQV